MSNDLISREALKADIDSYIKRHNISELDKAKTEWLVLELFKGFIDNAPTVKPCENCDLYFKAMTKEEMKKGGAE